jgi:hypothetical protein
MLQKETCGYAKVCIKMDTKRSEYETEKAKKKKDVNKDSPYSHKIFQVLIRERYGSKSIIELGHSPQISTIYLDSYTS